MNLWLVIFGAAVGAPLRYLVDTAVSRRTRRVFPWGTFAVNMAASVVLGVVTGAVAVGAASHRVQLLIGTGLRATLSTYSTFSFETVRLFEDDQKAVAVGNVVAILAAGVAGRRWV